MVSDKVNDMLDWWVLGEKADALTTLDDKETSAIQSKNWNQVTDLNIQALRSLNNEDMEIDAIYPKFIGFVLEFLEISCNSGVTEAQRSAKSAASKVEAFDLFEILTDLKKQKFDNYNEMKSSYEPIVKRINKLNKLVLFESEIDKTTRRKRFINGSLITLGGVAIGAVLTWILS